MSLKENATPTLEKVGIRKRKGEFPVLLTVFSDESKKRRP